MNLEYPAKLSPAYWDKHKGAVAKMAGKTGVGEALKALVKKYEGVNWSVIDPTTGISRAKTAEELAKYKKAAQEEYYGAGESFYKEIEKARKVLDDVHDKFTKNKLIPQKSTDLVGDMLNEIKSLDLNFKKLSVDFKQFDVALSKLGQGAGEEELPLEDYFGSSWFNLLEKFKWHKNANVVAFCSNKIMTLSAKDGQPSAELTRLQSAALSELKVFVTNHGALTAARKKPFKKKAAVQFVKKHYYELSSSMMVMKPGMQGIIREWAVKQSDLAGTKEVLASYQNSKTGTAAMLIQKACEQLLVQEEVAMNKLEEVVDRAVRQVL